MRIIGLFFTCFFSVMVCAQPSVLLLRDKIKIGEQTELIYQFKGDVFKKDLFPVHEKVIKCAIIGNKTKKSTDLEIIGLFNDTLKKNKNEIERKLKAKEEMVNKFKVDETPELNKENISETNKTVPTS